MAEMNTEEIASREASARRYHSKGLNCCQSVVLAYADLLPVEADAAAKTAAAFGRGVSGMGEICGCVSGMAMVCGMLDRTPEFRNLAARFREICGDVNCGRLLQGGRSKMPCGEMVACAARLLGEIL